MDNLFAWVPRLRTVARLMVAGAMVVFATAVAQSVFSPIATASGCGNGDVLCDSANDGGMDRFCLDIKWFKICWEVFRYFPVDLLCTEEGDPECVIEWEDPA